MSLDILPVEWLLTELNQVLSVKNGYAFKSKDYISEKTSDDLVPVIRISDIKDNSVSTLKSVFVEKAKASENFKIDKGDLLIAMSGATTGKTGIFREENPAFLNQRVGNLKVHSQEYFLPKFRNFLIQNLSNQILENAYGGAQPNISSKDIESLKFGLPSLAEQQEIVRQLDIMLAQVEQIKARLDAIPAILKKFRQSVLADAVSGDLLKNTNLIFNKLALKKLTTKIGSGATPKGGNSAYQEVGIPLVRSLNIHTNYIKYKDLAFINQEQADKLKNVEIFKDDVLLNITGASIGRVNITPKEFIGGRVNQHVAIIRCDQTKLLPQYLHIYLASPNLQKWIEGENYGATRQALTKGMLDSLVVEFPSIEDQIKIISKVNELFNFSNTIEQTAQSAQKRVNLLTQSILAKAFSGELTAEWREQHQELITGINSAESLLAKIQAGREASKPVKKAKKVK